MKNLIKFLDDGCLDGVEIELPEPSLMLEMPTTYEVMPNKETIVMFRKRFYFAGRTRKGDLVYVSERIMERQAFLILDGYKVDPLEERDDR
jgi:hypothetical protein